ncbi:glycoside hydrolase family 2 TIM barrel-domain containing protein [Kribbella deserti]|uniref:beta-galactosidase n=1 Tax=Kribbella deserti TaxID=1926257 RepID=A0ABV6QHA6_9ACTN
MALQRRNFLALSAAAGAAGLAGLRPDLARAVSTAGTATERLLLTGRDREQTVDWDFMVTSGRRAGTWAKIPTPSHWEFHGFGTYNWGFNLVPEEKGHYRHSFSPPARWQDKRTYLVFEGSMTDTEVWINGQSAGPRHRGGFYRFRYDVTDLLRLGSPNHLEVVVHKESSDESVNRAERMGDYWNFGGIFRPVYLQAVPAESIERLAVDARADGSFAVDVYLDRPRTADRVVAQIRKLDGTPVGKPFAASIAAGESTVTLRTNAGKIRTWNAEAPNLYQVEVRLYAGQREWHRTSERFGFRTVEVRPGDGVYINGSKIVFKGANRHTSWPTSGRTSSRKLSRDDILLMKEMNMNAVRMAHYPPDTHFLDLCDELGLYVLDELAGWQKKYDEEVAAPLVKSLVTRDVNHPSVVFWCNGNEGGWNTALDSHYERYDPQGRKVLHPWATFSDINTDHYESYDSTKRILEGDTIFMSTEFLHGLYDGGSGAGLDDYWKLMAGTPLGAGGFLWALADEGVVRDDRDGAMDVMGNAAPDGIVGPFREREASFATIKDIWSPVQLTDADALRQRFPARFTGQIPITNRYHFTNTKACRFTWTLSDFATPASGRTGSTVRVRGTAAAPDIAPGASGVLDLKLPLNWRRFDALTVTVEDSTGLELTSWRLTVGKAADRVAKLVDRGNWRHVNGSADGSLITMRAGRTEIQVDASTGRLAGVRAGGRPISLANGPALSTGTATLAGLTHGAEGASYVIKAQYSGDLRYVQWRLHPSGWLQLDYEYSLAGAHPFFGVDFDYPEAAMTGLTWLGQGPYRVWKNRRRGLLTDVWHKTANDTATGASGWEYPEFKGYHAETSWAMLHTTEGQILVVAENDDLFLRVGTPKMGPDPRFTAPPFPAGNLSFLDAIPAIGTKFDPPTALGPQSQPTPSQTPHPRTLHFNFTP